MPNILVTVSPKVSQDLRDMELRYCEAGKLLPCITFGVLASDDPDIDSNGEPIFLIGTLERETPSGMVPHQIFFVGDMECGLQLPPEFELLTELHFDYRRGKLVNTA
jgi:hypothetical protein